MKGYHIIMRKIIPQFVTPVTSQLIVNINQ